MKVERCYDSHLHLEATGEFAERLSLFHFSNLKDLENLRPQSSQKRGPWWMGFGIQPALHAQLHLTFFDQWSEPLYFMTSDGHGVWVNSALLQSLPIAIPSQVPGFFKDQEKDKLDLYLPEPSVEIRKAWILKAQQKLHAGGFTHVRDMTWDLGQVRALEALEKEGSLKLFVEGYYWLKEEKHWPQFLNFLENYQTVKSSQIKLRGVKIFYDGALGTNGALLSMCSCHKKNQVIPMWSKQDFSSVLKKCWDLNLEIAVHAIGDEAIHQVAQMTYEVQNSTSGRGKICIEHAELVRPETFEVLKALNCEIHMQPSHLLMDQQILKPFIDNKKEWVFPWQPISKHGIPLFWGSDSPIVSPDFFRTEQALIEAQNLGILAPKISVAQGHQHPNSNWGAGCWTEFKGKKVHALYFQGQRIDSLK